MIGEKTREILNNLDFDSLIELYFNDKHYEDVVERQNGNERKDDEKSDQERRMP